MLKFFDKLPKNFGRYVKCQQYILFVKGEKKMNLGNKILQLRKKNGLSQEQLGEVVDVTRQTISNWELGETTPNPEQLKRLSKAFNVSIDEILDNESKEFLMNKISNTERLAGIIIKILKVVGFIFIGYVVFMIIAVISLGIYTVAKKDNHNVESSATTICSIDNKKYQIEFGTNDYFKCDSCSKEMSNEIKKIVNFNNIDNSMANIDNYFKSHSGTCEQHKSQFIDQIKIIFEQM